MKRIGLAVDVPPAAMNDYDVIVVGAGLIDKDHPIVAALPPQEHTMEDE